jgi:hypothetical protein
MSTTTTPVVSPDLSLLSKEQQERIVYGKDDALFGYIEKQQHELLSSIEDTTVSVSSTIKSTLFGHVLDAGTGLHSLRWIASLCYMNLITSFTAITADATIQQNCQNEINDLGIAQYGTILCGHWLLPSSTASSSSSTIEHANHVKQQNGDVCATLSTTTSTISISEQLHGQQFDVIIVDYLIGAMDGFIPYQQDLILPILISFLQQKQQSNQNNYNSSSCYHSRLYIIGLEPIPDQISNKTSFEPQNIYRSNIMNLICQVRQVRDACILLAGQRCYREYPMEWILRQFETYMKSHNNNNISVSKSKNDSQCVEEYNHHHCNQKIYKYNSKQFPILYRHTTIVKQINVGRSKLLFIPIVIRHTMEQLLNDLENQSKQYFDKYIASQQQQQELSTSTIVSGKIQFGFDYVVTIECT